MHELCHDTSVDKSQFIDQTEDDLVKYSWFYRYPTPNFYSLKIIHNLLTSTFLRIIFTINSRSTYNVAQAAVNKGH